MSGFGALWGSQATSNFADGLLVAAAPLLVASFTRDPVVVAGMTVAQFLPWLLSTLPAGALTDRADRRAILVAGNLLRAAAFCGLAVGLWAGTATVWLLYTVVFVAGVAETLVDNAALTVPPRVVPRAQLERANGRLFATQSVINTFVGPPVGSALMAIAGSIAIATGAGLFALAAAAALMLPRLRPQPVEAGTAAVARSGMLAQIGDGWREFWGNHLLRRVAMISGAINFFGTLTGSVLVLLATGPLGIPAAAYGLFLAVPAAGAVLGSLVAHRVVPRIGGGAVTWCAALLPAASYAVLASPAPLPLALIALFVAAIATALNQVVVSTLRQASVRDALLGRVTSAYRLIVLGVVPFGAVAGGLLASAFGIRNAFLIAAAGLAVAALVLAPRVTTAALRAAELPARPEREPQTPAA